MNTHPLLERQIKRLCADSAPSEEMDALFDEISQVYHQNERALTLLERALDLTSEELLSENNEMERELNSLRGAHDQMEQLLTLFNSTMESSTDGILLVDGLGDPVFYNERTPAFLGTTNEVLSCLNYDSFLELITAHVKDASTFSQQLEQIWHNPQQETRCTLEFHDGRVLDCCSRPYEDKSDHKGVGRIWNFHDITELTEREREAQHRALHDPLTGLPNRILFLDRLQYALLRSHRKQSQVALLFIDLDGFKHVNDNMGHHIGDELLKSVTERLCESVRENDSVGRQGGDEFLVLLDEINNMDEVCIVAERLLEALRKPFIEEEHEIFISGSIGITMHPGDAGDPESLIRNADMAMYQAKKHGRDNYQFFLPELIDESSKQLTLQNKLNHALDEGEFSLLYQPILDMTTRNIVGAECLLRWTTAEGEQIAPNDFIPVAEQCGLIIPITEWVIAAACEQARLWKQEGLTDLMMSLNVSGMHFKKGHLVESLQTHISLNKLNPTQLGIEVTESAIIFDLENSAKTLQSIQDYGIHVSIDDFGTGYSSFNYLKNLPINTVKIDRSFVSDIHESERDLELVKSIVSISHTLGLDVIAEGVETEEMSDQLKSIGCDRAQGYLYSHPITADAFSALVKAEA